jgi:hypothetical protein
VTRTEYSARHGPLPFSKNTLQRRSDLCIPRNETEGPHSQYSPLFICERFLYSHDRSTYFAAANSGRPTWEYRNRFQIHEGRNWERYRAVSLLGIFVSNFRYSIFAVHPVYFIPLFESLNPCLQSTTLPSLWLQLSKHRIGVLTILVCHLKLFCLRCEHLRYNSSLFRNRQMQMHICISKILHIP